MLYQSCLRRKIQIPGGRTAYLETPTIREVIEIMGVLRNMEDADDLRLLFELLGGLRWERAIDITSQLHRLYQNDRKGFAIFLQGILLQGYNAPHKTQKDSKETDDTDTNWKKLLSEYCSVFGSEPHRVYNETPFPFFMEMIPEARRRRAENHIHSATENMFAMGGSKDIMNSWRRQAGWEVKSKAGNVTDVTDKQMKRNAEVLKNLRKRCN